MVSVALPAEPLKILLVSGVYAPYFQYGGPPRKIQSIANALVMRGHDVSVLTMDHSPRPRVREEDQHGVKVTYLGSSFGYGGVRLGLGVFSPAVRRSAPDVTHLFGFYEFLNPTAAVWCRERSIPFVLEPLGMFRPQLRSVGKKRLYHGTIGRLLVRYAAAIIASSEAERVLLAEDRVPAAKIIVRHNGVDLESFGALPPYGRFRDRLGITAREPLVLFLGRLAPVKGLDLLLRATARQRQSSTLAIVGPDERGYRSVMHRLAVELGIFERVRFVGPMFGSEKLSALVDADVFVLPSESESFGNSAAEALVCGTPVVVSDTCGIASLIEGRAGMVVPRSASAFAAALDSLVEDPGLRLKFSLGAQAIKGELSWNGPVQELEMAYRRALAG